MSYDNANNPLSPAQQRLVDVWEAHMRYEFEDKNVDATMSTMVVEGAHLINIPTIQGGMGNSAVRHFYTHSFLSAMPADIQTILVSRTVGESQIVDETILKFTHSIMMNWILPGIAPTGKTVEIALVVIVGFRDGKISHEHVYWDQASVLAQIGLLDANNLPIVGVKSARTVLNPKVLG